MSFTLCTYIQRTIEPGSDFQGEEPALRLHVQLTAKDVKLQEMPFGCSGNQSLGIA